MNVLGMGAIGGLLIGCWNNIKIIWTKISGLVIIRITLTEESGFAFARTLIEEWTPLDTGEKIFTGYSTYVRPERKNLVVGYKNIPKNCIWKKNKKFIFVSGEIYNLNIKYIRGTFKYNDLIQKAIDKYNNEYKKSTDRFEVLNIFGNNSKNNHDKYSNDEKCTEAPEAVGAVSKFTTYPLKWKREELGYKSNSDNPFETLYYEKDIIDSINEIQLWFENGYWFKEKMIPWKRGYLLYGNAGTGKTAFVRSIAQMLKIPIYAIDLATLTNDQLIQKWNKICSNSPCIALFEDLDTIFDGRKNIACEGHMEKGVTFDCLLNILDGVNSSDGILTFITTNNISKLDNALGNPYNGNNMSTRPGRIDKVIELGNISLENKKIMAERILGDFDRQTWINDISFDNEDSPAQFQERCSRMAMKLWEEENLK